MKGFTLIELIIVLAIVGIIASVILGAFGVGQRVLSSATPSSVSCQNGFRVITGSNGYQTQMIDENGKGIPCS